MMDFKKVMDEVYANKIAKGFNVTDIQFELLRLNEEVAELSEAIWKKKSSDEIGAEVADVMLYLLSVAYMADVPDVEVAVYKKLIENSKRKYQKDENGILIRVDDTKEEK